MSGVIAGDDLDFKLILKVQHFSHIKKRYKSRVYMICKASIPQSFPRQREVLAASRDLDMMILREMAWGLEQSEDTTARLCDNSTEMET